MTYGAFAQDFASHEFELQDFVSHKIEGARKPMPRAALCGVALALTTSVGLWALYARPVAVVSAPQSVVAAAVVTPVAVASAPLEAAPPAKIAVPLRAAQAAGPMPASKAEAKVDPALLYPSLTSGYAAGTFKLGASLGVSLAASTPHRAEAAVPVAVAALAPTAPMPPSAASAAPPAAPSVAAVPLPRPRPAALVIPRDKAPAASAVARPIIQAKVDPTATPAAPGASETFFDKMFNAARPSGNALAYAAPEDGGLFGGARPPSGGYDRFTAIYDITAHTVYLPDGTRLEAHSGLGPYKDNPASVAMRMVGVTPPNLYDLTFREAPFHGVRALRLTPTGGTTYGRAGLLAHTYMLRGRPPGESNGCVVFKDYQAFLRAFESGQIRRLAVVVRMARA